MSFLLHYNILPRTIIILYYMLYGYMLYVIGIIWFTSGNRTNAREERRSLA